MAALVYVVDDEKIIATTLAAILINNGYWLVCLLISGAVLAVWR